MHIPKHFAQNDPEQLKDLIRTYPFATLITHSAAGIEANHIPLLLAESDGKNVLQGHIAKANPLWKQVQSGAEVLVIFHGPNSYISPNYYPTKQEHGKVVPTWNYVTVHVKGAMNYIHDADWNREIITRLTDHHEAGQVTPWSVVDAPEAFTEKMLSAIVGLQIDIFSMVGKWKVSQNQPEQNKQGVVDGLSQGADREGQQMAALVKEQE